MPVASGGHSHIIQVLDYTRFRVLGRTVDDQAGEAFDKVRAHWAWDTREGRRWQGRRGGRPRAYSLPTPKLAGRYDVSFSGLKTAVLNLVNQAGMKGETVSVPDMAASFQFRATEILAEKLMLAARETGAEKVCIAGGVAANTALRSLLERDCAALGAALYLPRLSLCGDNAAMIAAAGYYEYLAGSRAASSLNGLATLPIDY